MPQNSDLDKILKIAKNDFRKIRKYRDIDFRDFKELDFIKKESTEKELREKIKETLEKITEDNSALFNTGDDLEWIKNKPKEEQNCMNTSSFGTGELIKDAINNSLPEKLKSYTGYVTVKVFIGLDGNAGNEQIDSHPYSDEYSEDIEYYMLSEILSTKWIPASKEGKSVGATYTFVIEFAQ